MFKLNRCNFKIIPLLKIFAVTSLIQGIAGMNQRIEKKGWRID